jgi:hypothetical protein
MDNPATLQEIEKKIKLAAGLTGRGKESSAAAPEDEKAMEA